MISQASSSVMYDGGGNAVPLNRVKRRLTGQAKAMLGGFKGANDEQLADWVFLPLEINQILKNDLRKLRARSRDLAWNDDTARRFLSLLKQNVLGHRGIGLQAKNKLRNGKPDKRWNAEIEREWKSFAKKRRHRGRLVSPSACGQMSLRQLQWLVLNSRAVDGECFIQILRGYPHNKHRFAIRLLNPDLLDHTFSSKAKNGNRIEMGIELDEFSVPVAYHFSKDHPQGKSAKRTGPRISIPADQIIHVFRKEYAGQLRGIPDFAAVMHKAKMLNGVNEAVVVGWRVAACKMGFFVSKDSEDFPEPGEDPDDPTVRVAPESTFDATPGQIDYIDDAKEFREFNPEYPTSTYAEGHKTFMRQLANGLNVSSPTLMNDYSDVNYSSLRQALLEDREGWRCIQADLADDFEQPLFDEWYDWTANVTRLISVPDAKRGQEPEIVHQFRGWPWVDPLKEVKAQLEAVNGNLRTRQSVMSDTDGADFTDTVDAIRDENEALESRGLKQAPAAAAVEDEAESEVDNGQ